jgi:hypothetical protein
MDEQTSQTVSSPGGDAPYLVSGVVLAESGRALAGAVVELWDKDHLDDDYLGQTETDAGGRFSLAFDRSRFQGLLKLEKYPDVYFKVFKDGQVLYDSAEQPLADLGDEPLSVTLRLVEGPLEPPVVVSRRSIDEGQPLPAGSGAPVDPAGFGIAFARRVFTQELLARETERLIGAKDIQQEQDLKQGPIAVHVVSDARVGAPVVRRVADLSFDVTIPVSMAVRLEGQLGPLRGRESYAIEARASFRLDIQLHDTLLIYVDASRVEGGHVALATRAQSVTHFARGQVEAGVREQLARQFNQALAASRGARTIDVLGEVQPFLDRRAPRSNGGAGR